MLKSPRVKSSPKCTRVRSTSADARAERILGAVAWALALFGLCWLAFGAARYAQPNAAAQAPPPDEDTDLFHNGLVAGWQDWSWADHDLNARDVMFDGRPTIRVTPAQYKGLYLHHGPLSLHGYRFLTFWVRGAGAGGQRLTVCAVDSAAKFGKKVPLEEGFGSRRVPAGRFELCVIPLDKLGVAELTITGICFQDAAGTAQPPVYLADVRIGTGRKRAPRGAIAVNVDLGRRIGPISPYIYGVAQPGPEQLKELRIKVWRWGGNPATRYNWVKGNCWNAARDWQFRNGDYGSTSPADRKPSGVADRGIAMGKSFGADALITIPTMGWVARDDNNGTASANVPGAGGPPKSPGSEAIRGYDPSVNRARVSVASLPRKGRPFSETPDPKGPVYQDEWVAHLVNKFGTAAHGGVRFYAMDNEPDLWDATHTDMHPVRPTYDEILSRFLSYSTAVKAVDPTAMITGPVSWGWTGYFFSPRDRGDDNFRAHADRSAHGDVPFLPWFLQQVAHHDARTGKRTLDYLDVHYYPQANGVYSGANDPATNALRLRSVRALWDPTYTDESWVGAPVQLIPRLHQWVTANYPGTKIALTEWNWGADQTLNGGLAVADALGIFGREQLDMACYWVVPGVGSPSFFAYKLYRNADGLGHGFGDVAVSSASSDTRAVSVYAAADNGTGAATIMLLNKLPEEAATVNLALNGIPGDSIASVYRYDGSDLKKIVKAPDIGIRNGRARIVLPAYSMTLLRCKRR